MDVELQGCGRDFLFHTLGKLGISFSVGDYDVNIDVQNSDIRGTFCKNLLLKDRKSQFYLVICHSDHSVCLKTLKSQLSAHRNFSFATEIDLMRILRVKPGAVTPFGLLYQSEPNIRVIIHECLSEPDRILHFHPFVHDKTLPISFSDLNMFISHCGFQVEIHDFMVK